MGFTTNPRNQWYDRNPVSRVSYYFITNVAPHAQTQRWSYTVPANKKFQTQFLTNNLCRDLVTATPGAALSYCDVIPVGGATSTIQAAIVEAGTLDAKQGFGAGCSMILLAGDTIVGKTQDGSTGGTCAYQNSVEGIEFDA